MLKGVHGNFVGIDYVIFGLCVLSFLGTWCDFITFKVYNVEETKSFKDEIYHVEEIEEIRAIGFGISSARDECCKYSGKDGFPTNLRASGRIMQKGYLKLIFMKSVIVFVFLFLVFGEYIYCILLIDVMYEIRKILITFVKFSYL